MMDLQMSERRACEEKCARTAETRKHVLGHINERLFSERYVYPPRTDSAKRYLVAMVSALIQSRSPANDTRFVTGQ